MVNFQLALPPGPANVLGEPLPVPDGEDGRVFSDVVFITLTRTIRIDASIFVGAVADRCTFNEVHCRRRSRAGTSPSPASRSSVRMISTSTPLAADRVGSGDPLLLLHGIGTTRADFGAVLPRLAEHYDVLAMDLPGHGASPALERRHTVAALADAVAADLEARGLDRIHVLGNSLGGRIALELARLGRARSVVAVAPSGMGSPPERLYQASSLIAARLAMSSIRSMLPALAPRRAARTALLAGLRARPWATTEAEALALRDGFAEARRFWETLWWTVVADLPTGMSDVACPVTLVQGGLDWIAPGQAARYLATVRGARFEPVVLAGHAAQGDRPVDIVRIVRATTAQAPLEEDGE